MEPLNSLELLIFDRLSGKYPSIKHHIPFLRVLNREFTGVGMYVNFCYLETAVNISPLDLSRFPISTNENIIIPTLQYGLGYEVVIDDGKINFIEFVTYGEKWDGNMDNYLIKP